MSLTRYVGLLAGSTLGLTAAAFASSVEASNDTLSQLAELRREVAELKAAQGQQWLTEERAKEIRSIVQDVLADADTRASLQSSGATAGYDNGFFIASPDGNFKLVVNGELQVRWAMSRLSSRSLGQLDPGSFQPPETGAQNEFPGGFENKGYQGFFGQGNSNGIQRTARGFSVPRAKLEFSGHVVDPSWQYRIVGAFEQQTTQAPFSQTIAFGDGQSYTFNAPSGTYGWNNPAGNGSLGSNFGLEDAYIVKVLDPNWSIKVGQFKAPLLREELVSSKYQLAVERSLVNQFFSTEFTQGIELTFQNDCFRAMVSYNDGGNNANTSSTIGNSNQFGNFTQWAVTGRVEWLAFGTWEQFNDFSSPNGTGSGLLIGAAANWQSGGANDLNNTANSWTAPNSLSGNFGNLQGFPLQPVFNNQYPNNLPTSANSDVKNLTYTADISWELGGVSLYAAYVGNVAYGIPAGWVANPSGGFTGDNGNTPNNLSLVPAAWGGGTSNVFVPGYGYGNSPIFSHGVVVQAGWFIVDDLELFGRYEYYTTVNNNANGYAGNTPTFWGWVPGGSSPFANNTNSNGVNPGFPGPNAGINTPTDNGYEGSQTNPYYAYNLGGNPYAAQMNQVVTFGANWYPAGVKNRNIKLSGDLSYSINPVLFNQGIYGRNIAITDFRSDGGQNGGGQWVSRVQLQLLF
ncbi:MAG: hypothetical protein KF724_12600 [Phycisphaeraceae bacterium]|nr:hypothetical protein [Phycisphaeraceae bacterium]